MKLQRVFNNNQKNFPNTGNSKQQFETKFGAEIFKNTSM